MKKIIGMIILAIALILAVLFLANPVKAITSISNGEWGEWTDTSSCNPVAECGTIKGTKTQERSCVLDWGSNECSPEHSTWGEWEDGYDEWFNSECAESGRHGCKTWRHHHWILVPAQTDIQTVDCEVPLVKCPQEPTKPVSKPVKVENPLTPAGAPICGGIAPSMIPNALSKRIGSTNALVVYWPTTVGGQVNIRYREEGSNVWQHALRDYPNLGVAPIGFLKADVKYEYQLTNGDRCAQSLWSKVFKGL
jgi:hypothetical protein